MKVTLIVPYFGQWPPWFPAFMLSCQRNPGVEWLFYTDCEPPPVDCPNVSFVKGTLASLSKLATVRTGMKISLQSPYKICDLRPAFGEIFNRWLTDSDFWGHCDVDVIWGDIRRFITNDTLRDFDLVSSRRFNMSGHFTLYRNNPKINSLYRLFARFGEMINARENYLFDENGMTEIVRHLLERQLVSVYWPKFLLNFAHPKTDAPSDLRAYTEGWYWQDGRLFDQTEGNEEIMYLHFMTWKDSLKNIDFGYENPPGAFHITATGIRAAE